MWHALVAVVLVIDYAPSGLDWYVISPRAADHGEAWQFRGALTQPLTEAEAAQIRALAAC